MKQVKQKLQDHWERIYQEKGTDELSWTQEIPESSLNFIKELGLNRSSRIIDVGGGDSKLVDHLLGMGYRDITVLDLSRKALEKAKKRLGEMASCVEWAATDVLNFEPSEPYDLWHDRATFHFLTEPDRIEQYRKLAEKAVRGYMLIGTFSDEGPENCSGLPVHRYDEKGIEETFSPGFELLKTWRENHITPGGSSQNFLFAAFQKKEPRVQ